jgi:ketosteroid isomerase-like protein
MTNLEIVQEIYEAFATEGIDRVLQLCDANCRVTQDTALPWGGEYEGLDGVLAFGAALGGTIQSVISSDELFAAGDHVIQYGRSRGTVIATGVAFDSPEVHVWTVRGGKVTAAEFYVDTAAMLGALGEAS